MCRLLAYAAPRSTTFGDLLGEATCRQFTSMARLHRDGWGTAFVDERHEVLRVRSDSSALIDPRYAGELAVPSRARIAHLRFATDSMDVQTTNSHPFLGFGMAFAHNGSLVPVRALRHGLRSDMRHLIDGTTDSEMYFAWILQSLSDAGDGDLPRAVARTVSELRHHYPLASLNCLLLSAEELIVVRASHLASAPTDQFAESGLAPEELPPEHLDAYFRVVWRRFADRSIAFSSAGIDRTGWTKLPDESITVVDLDTLDAEVRPLEAALASAS